MQTQQEAMVLRYPAAQRFAHDTSGRLLRRWVSAASSSGSVVPGPDTFFSYAAFAGSSVKSPMRQTGFQ